MIESIMAANKKDLEQKMGEMQKLQENIISNYREFTENMEQINTYHENNNKKIKEIK